MTLKHALNSLCLVILVGILIPTKGRCEKVSVQFFLNNIKHLGDFKNYILLNWDYTTNAINCRAQVDTMG